MAETLGGINMRMRHKALALLIATIIVLSAFIAVPVTAYANAAPIVKGTFTIETFDDYDPGELDYYYSDRYFSSTGKDVDPHLRTMSAALVFTSQGTSEVPDETYGKILRNIGFTDIETYDMDHTAMDTMGVVIARKSVGGKDIVAVALRGDTYELEMASNLIAGAQGDIQAFADAEVLVESRVRAYIDQYDIIQAKYWVAGYSRSGAVANLFGRALNRDLPGFRTTDDDIYVYTFEAALGSAEDTAYENIHNIIDLRDTVTYVYPSLWSMYGCGVPDYIGNTDDTITLTSFSLLSDGHVQDMGEIKTVDFISDFMTFLGNNLSRKTYYEKLQAPVSQVAQIYYSLSKEQRLAFIEYFNQVFSELKNDNKLIPSLLVALAAPNLKRSAELLANLIIKHMDQVSSTSGKPVSDDEYETVRAAVLPIVSVLLPIAGKDSTASYDFGGARPKSAPFYHIMTFAGNLDSLFIHHYNYNVFDELTALDSYYQERIDYILGDVDGDGVVSVIDVTYIQRFIADIEIPFYLEKEVSDVDGDEEVTIIDATFIQRWLVNLACPEGIGKPV